MLRNDPAQYDGLADEWWQAQGGFAALHWLAASRAEQRPRQLSAISTISGESKWARWASGDSHFSITR